MTGSERILERLISARLVSHWVTPNPFKLTNGVAKEIADAVFALQGHVILFSDKTSKLSCSGDAREVRWKRWQRNCIADSANQLRGALRHLKNDRENWFTSCHCYEAISEIVDWKEEFSVHLVSVVNCSEDEDRAKHPLLTAPYISCGYDSPETLRQLNHDDSIPFVHIFSQETLELVLEWFDTPSDLLHYLMERQSVLTRLRGHVFASECEIIALVLEFGTDVVDHLLSVSGFDPSYRQSSLLEGRFAALIGTGRLRKFVERREESKHWDRQIKVHVLNNSEGARYGSLLGDAYASSPADLARLMVWFNRVDRIAVMEAAFSMAKSEHFAMPGARSFRAFATVGSKFAVVVTMSRSKTDQLFDEHQWDAGFYCSSYVILSMSRFEFAEYVVGISLDWQADKPSLSRATYCAFPTAIRESPEYERLVKTSIAHIGPDPRGDRYDSSTKSNYDFEADTLFTNVTWHGEAAKYRPT